MKKRMLALVMTLAMCLSLLPVSALAAEGDKVAKIGETQYETLDAAITEAQDGDTIELLADCTTGGITLNNKSLMIQGTGSETIAFRTKGIHAIDSDLTFKNCKIDMVISDHPGGNGATANLIDDSDLTLTGVTMALTNDHSDAAGESGIYLYQGSNLYINGGSDITISGFKDAKESSGIYADNSEYENQPNREIVIDSNSKLLITQCGWHGMTINPIDLTVKNGSSVTLTENGNESYGGGLGCYYGKLTLSNGSAMIANNNQGVGWGIFIKDLSIDSTSTLEACNNTGAGLAVGGKGTIATGAKVRLNDNGAMGLWVYKIDDPWAGDVTIEDNVDLEILRNKNRGIYNANLLTMKSGLVMNNATTSSGGGIGNMRSGTATLSDAVKLYNNHASVAGDDICSTGTITFGSVGSGWALDGAPDCTDAIDGWYVDGTNDRWSAHKKPVHVEEFTADTVEGYLALKAAHGLIPLDPGDSGTENWAISKSKTATNLDKNYESKVTLSLPAAEESLVSDVVFVLDESSCSEPVKAKVAEMLDALYQQIEDTNASIKIGAVQFCGEVTQLPLTELTESTKESVTAFMSSRPATGGSNMSAGLLAGEKMLDADTQVDNGRKYLILVSDGITYIWDDETTESQENYGVNFANRDAPNVPRRASPDGWDVKHGNSYLPTDWDAELNSIASLLEKTIKEKASVYERGANETAGKAFVAYSDKDTYASTVDIALYKSYQAYQSIASKYNAYAVVSGEENDMAAFPFGPSFMNYLADGEEVSFNDIQNDIIYLLDAGSKVEDYIGYKENDYNFDFVNDASKLTLKVGDVTYPAEKIAENQYGFCPFASIASETDGEIAPAQYAYVLTYVPGNQKDTEHFVWDINVPVSNFAPVQLTYTVKLTNPQTSAGTYGQYDADGSEKYAGLYTNNSATLYPVDSNGDKGVPENFPKPTVSYTVSGGSGGGGGGGSVKPPVLNTKDHYGYIIGYPVDYITGETTNDQTRMPVKPEGNITRAEVATIFFRMLTDDSRNQFWSQSSEYSDVKTSDWFNNAICTLSNAGILSGYDDGTFAPNGKITRAEFATIASRFFEYKDSEGNNPFNDVDENSWYYQYILAASQMGLINGYPDGTFQPNNYITRAEAVTIVNRTLDRHPDQDHFLKDMLVWVDNMDTGKWYYADMQEATNSHEYEMKGSGDSKYENWTKMLEIRDWAAFEKAWSDANSASGGEVTK